MSHDRGCPCGKEPYEYADCTMEDCTRRAPALVEARVEQLRAGATVHELPTRPDALLADVQNAVKIMREIASNGLEVARMRKTMYDAYVEAGFTPEQALTLLIQRPSL